MAFMATKGGKKRVRAIVVIRSKSGTRAGRAKELSRFKKEVRSLAKRYRGSVKALSK